ncbi:MAG: hypothetical protein ACKOPM_08640 [Novosphingobium sp.]
MATAFDSPASLQGTEERFFFKLACAIGLVLVAGFSIQLAAGRSSFAVPLIYHLHGVVFFGWVVLFLTQSFLVASGNVALHRRLGWLSALWVPLMVALAAAITVTSLRRTGGPFFFDANEFLFGNVAGALTFAGMVFAAVRMRRRTDWHRRLMIGAMAAITGPGWGRLLPTPLFIPYGWEITNSFGMLFILAGMVRDKRVNGAVHPAWLVGLAAGLGWIAIGELIAYTPWAIDFTRDLMAGYPGAARPMEAYLP